MPLIRAQLPSYLDQGDSSLIYMIDNFINKSENSESNYIKYDLDVLKNLILKLKDKTSSSHWFNSAIEGTKIIAKYELFFLNSLSKQFNEVLVFPVPVAIPKIPE